MVRLSAVSEHTLTHATMLNFYGTPYSKPMRVACITL
jgi:hypothetical protein